MSAAADVVSSNNETRSPAESWPARCSLNLSRTRISEVSVRSFMASEKRRAVSTHRARGELMISPIAYCFLLGPRRSADCIIYLRDDLGRIFYLHDQAIVGFALQVDHDGLVTAAMHIIEPYPRYVDARYSPSPPQCVLDLRVCFRALHML